MTMTSDTPVPAETITVYRAIGGRGALSAAVEDFFGRLLADPRARPVLPPRRRPRAPGLPGEALGGPERYRGPDIAAAHHGLGITGAHFDLAAAHLYATLDGLGVPRHLSDHIVGIVGGLRPAVVTA